MRFRTLTPLLLVSILTRLVTANDIEPGKEFYTATHLTKTVAIDGKLDEWAGVPVLADPKFAIPKGSGTNGTYVLFEQYSGGTWTGPDDQTSAVQVAWDSDNVYFGFVVTDDYHENTSGNAWNGDSVQLMIADSTRTQQVALYNYSLGGYEDATGKLVVTDGVIINHEAGPGGDSACNCATDAVVARDSANKKTIYEIKLPAASLGLTAPLTAGTQFGLGMAINDGDGALVDGVQYGQVGQDGQRGWGGLGAHAIVFGKTASETALVTLGTNTPGTDRIFLSAINPTFGSFSFRATDKGASIVDPASAKLTLDTKVVTLTSKKSGDATDFNYVISPALAPGSEHTYAIELKDTQGNTVTSQGTFKLATPTFPTDDLPAPPVVNKAWAIRFIYGTDPISDLVTALTKAKAAGAAGFTGVSVNTTNSVIDYGTGGMFTGDIPYPDAILNDATTWTGNDFVMVAVGHLDVPQEADYTFGVHSDDGFGLRIRGAQATSVSGTGQIDPADSEAVMFPNPTGDSDTRAVYHLKKGVFRIEFVWFQGTGGAFSELYAVKGAFQNDADSTDWKLVGDTTSPGALQLTDAPVSSTTSASPSATVARSGNNIVIQWSPAGGTLETTSSLSGTPTWTAVGATNPATVPIGQANAFYRVRQ